MPVVAPRTAASRSASGNTMLGDFPPSSSVMRFSVSAEPRMISLPVDVSPVNAILSMPGCATIIRPTLEPGPVTTFRTPGGMPASWAISASARAVIGVWPRLASHCVSQARPARPSVAMSNEIPGTIAATTPTALAACSRQFRRPGMVCLNLVRPAAYTQHSAAAASRSAATRKSVACAAAPAARSRRRG